MRIQLRDAVPGDVAFVMSTWTRTWRASPWAGVVPNHLFQDVTRTAIAQLLARGARIRLATLGDRLVAWICQEVTRDGVAVVHAGYAKDPYVELRPLEELVAAAPGTQPGFYTFRTPQLARALPGWRHAPEIARRK